MSSDSDRPTTASQVRILLVDDQELVRSGFRMILEVHPDLSVVGEAANGQEAIALSRRLRPDVTLLDIQMPGMTGLEALPQLLPGRVVVLTTFESDEYVYQALRGGASGFLLKNAPPDELVQGVRAVARGGALLAPSITRRLIGDFANAHPDASLAKQLDALTDREREVLMLIARGLSNAEIATELFLGEETIKSHVSSLLRKLGLRDRVQAVVFAYEAGAVTRGQAPRD